MQDTIFLKGMRFYGYHGALSAENEIGQIFKVDVTLKVDLAEAGGVLIMLLIQFIMVKCSKRLNQLWKVRPLIYLVHQANVLQIV